MVRGLPERITHRRRDIHVVGQFCERDLDRSFRLRPDQRCGDPPGIPRIALAHGFERHPGVGDAARQRPLRRHQMREHRPLGRGALVKGWDAALRRLDGDDAVAVRRPAQRTADVVAVRDGADAGRDRRTGAARRSAAGDLGIPRVQRQPVQRVVGKAAEREFGRIGQAEHDRAGFFEVAHDRRIGGAMMFICAATPLGLGRPS